jgi:hypothetical protein
VKDIILATLLLIGTVDQINGDIAMIEYEDRGRIKYSYVSLSQSACRPTEGQSVHFFEGYKIVACVD